MNKHEWIQSLTANEVAELLLNIQRKAIERGRALTVEDYIKLLREEKANE